MRFHLWWRSVPELAPLSRKEFSRLSTQTRWTPFRYWHFWLILAVWIAITAWLLGHVRDLPDGFMGFLVYFIVSCVHVYALGIVRLHYQLPEMRVVLERRARARS